LVEAPIAYLSAQFAAGVEAVQIFKSFAGASIPFDRQSRSHKKENPH
jgi:uroporphyrinogen-III decarboxylase